MDKDIGKNRTLMTGSETSTLITRINADKKSVRICVIHEIRALSGVEGWLKSNEVDNG